MWEKKAKHLQLIQGVISRMSSNSFLLKGWSITLVSALFALAAKDTNIGFVLISYIVIPVFWILDGFFISQEKQYRALYNKVRLLNDGDIDFDLDATEFNLGKRTWGKGIFSKTLVPFYGVAIFSTLLVMFLLGNLNG